MKRVLVTGGSRGLGLAICRRLVTEGYEVVTASRQPSPPLIELQAAFPERLRYCAVDLAQPGAVAKLAQAAGIWEGIDGFVANAGIGTEGLLTLTSEAAIRACIEVNLISTILLAREVVKAMLDRGGSLVFISSVAARTGLKGLSVYSASKGALVALSRSLAREYGGRGIRSNCILPGFMMTEMSQALSPEDRDKIRRRTPLQRLAEVDEVAASVCFLLSESARSITGTEIVVDGGMTA